GKDELEDPEVGRASVELDARVLRGAGGLLVRGQQRVLKRRHQRLGVDSLLLLERPNCLDDLLGHDGFTSESEKSGIRFERWTSSSGMSTRSPPASTHTLRSSAAVSVPVNLRRPSISPRVRPRTRLPTKRRKCSGLVSGRSSPGEETSSE